MDKEVNFLNDEYLNKYLDYLLYEKNLSRNTLASYKEDIKDLYNYNRNYLKMNDNDILKYLSTLEALSRRSIAHHITVLRSLYGFLTRESIIQVNPCDKLIMPKLEQNLPEYLTSEEIKTLLAIDLKKPKDYRNKAMLELLIATGLRISELTNLRVSDIDFSECYLRVLGKGRKERIVPIDDEALYYTKLYLEYYRNSLLKKNDSEYLFISSYGKKITRQAFFKFLKEECSKKGIKKEVSPHTLRHSFATILLKNGANIRIIQELLGHEDLKTTQIYTHLIDEKLKKDYEEYHPRSHK